MPRPRSDAEEDWESDRIKRRRVSIEERDEESLRESRGWEDGKQGLFDEAEYKDVDRRLERAIADITLDMLEAVRLSPQQLLHILEHPRCTEYLVGAYVRYPDLEEMENGDVNEHDMAYIAPLPAQITKLIPHEGSAASKIVIGDQSHNINYDFAIIQYTQRSDGSLKIRKGRMELALVQDSPFTETELRKWQGLLKMFSGRQGYQKLQSLPLILSATAAKLKSFTFTNDDVDQVLKSRVKSAEPFAHIAGLNFRDLYLRKNELDYNIRGRMDELQECSSPVARERIQQQIAELKAELEVVSEKVTHHEKLRRTGETRLSSASGAAGKDALEIGNNPSISWKQLEWVRTPKTLSWRQPMSYLDVIYPIKSISISEFRKRLENLEELMKDRFHGSAMKNLDLSKVCYQPIINVKYKFSQGKSSTPNN